MKGVKTTAAGISSAGLTWSVVSAFIIFTLSNITPRGPAWRAPLLYTRFCAHRPDDGVGANSTDIGKHLKTWRDVCGQKFFACDPLTGLENPRRPSQLSAQRDSYQDAASKESSSPCSNYPTEIMKEPNRSSISHADAVEEGGVGDGVGVGVGGGDGLAGEVGGEGEEDGLGRSGI